MNNEDDEFLKALGEKIKNLRIKKGLTQEQLAIKAGYTSRSTITKIEKGLVDIPQSKIMEFAKILGTSPLYLLNWTDNPDANKNILTIQKEDGQLIQFFLSKDTTDKVIRLINDFLGME